MGRGCNRASSPASLQPAIWLGLCQHCLVADSKHGVWDGRCNVICWVCRSREQERPCMLPL